MRETIGVHPSAHGDEGCFHILSKNVVSEDGVCIAESKPELLKL